MKLKSLSLEELNELQDNLNQEIKAREQARQEIGKILDRHGLTLADVYEEPPKPAAGKTAKKKASKKKKRRRKSATRGKVPPKYRNPDNPDETWAGRGRKPKWLEAKLAKGESLESFAIGAGPPASRKKASPKKKKVRRKKKRSSLKGTKVPPKYRNPDNSKQTWTGRGRKPKWVEAQLAKGNSLEDMLIE